MASKSKSKGNRIEREVVDIFKKRGYECQRAWGSNGRAMGEHEEVDVKAQIKNMKFKIQVKGRKAIADYLKPDTEVVNAQVLKEDRMPPYIVMVLEDFLDMIEN
jgi:Holliday junction resolvase